MKKITLCISGIEDKTAKEIRTAACTILQANNFDGYIQFKTEETEAKLKSSSYTAFSMTGRSCKNV